MAASCLTAATFYASRGWLVIPLHSALSGVCSCERSDCASPGKHPFGALVPRGLHDGTKDVEQIKDWWTRFPFLNVGIVTGKESGVVVLDLDRHGEQDGVESFRELEAKHGAVPITVRQLTGGGGEQILFKHPGGYVASRNRAFGPGIDVRGDGGYILAPPSSHRSGRHYEWDLTAHPHDVPLAEAPAWVLAVIVAAQPGKQQTAKPKFDTAGALRGVSEGVRDETCYKLACKLRAADVPFDIAKTLLIQAADSCTPPYSAGLAVEKVERAYRKFDPNEVTEDVRPEIVITTQIRSVVDASESALLQHDPNGIFQRGGMLVRLTRDGARGLPWLMRASASPVAVQIGDAALIESIADAARFMRVTEKSGKVTSSPAIPPSWVGKTLSQRGEWRFPSLESIVAGPCLLPDGSILETPGYESRSGVWYEPSGSFETVPDLPSWDDANAALHRLLEPIADFPVIDGADRAVYVAAILSILARPAIAGPCPAFAFRAPTPGSGKSLLADVVSIIGTGRPAAKMAAPKDDDEMRKRILAIAIQGDAVTCFDNVSGVFGGTSISLALTATEFEDRILGETRKVRAPLRTVWLITGNNIRFRGDTGRRVLPCDIDPKVEHPEDRDNFRHPDLLAHVRRSRGQLVRDALTILRGFHIANRPKHGHPPKGSFEHWDALVRGALIWVGADDPTGTVERIRDQADEEISSLRSALGLWGDKFGSMARTAAEAVHAAQSDADLLAALAGLARCPEKTLDPQRLGYAMRTNKGRIIDGMSFAEGAKTKAKITTWQVMGGDSDFTTATGELKF